MAIPLMKALTPITGVSAYTVFASVYSGITTILVISYAAVPESEASARIVSQNVLKLETVKNSKVFQLFCNYFPKV